MNQKYIEKIQLLEQENQLLKQRLSKYTNSPAYRKYYEANKEKINEKKRERSKIDYKTYGQKLPEYDEDIEFEIKQLEKLTKDECEKHLNKKLIGIDPGILFQFCRDMGDIKKIVVMISGGGTNLQALIDAINNGILLDVRIELVVSNKKQAYGLERASKSNIPTLFKSLKTYKDKGKTREDFDGDLAKEIINAVGGTPDLIVLAGFMHILSPVFLNAFPMDSIINLHPALPGQFDGARAIERAYDAFKKGEITETGVMIHCCTAEVDKGRVIIEETCVINAGESLERLEERMHEIEHNLIVQGTELALMMMVD